MMKRMIIFILLLPYALGAKNSYLLDCGLSGIFFRGGIAVIDSIGEYTDFDFRFGLLPFFPFALGFDALLQIRYGPVLFHSYAVDLEPINSYSSGTRMFGVSSGISFISSISEKFKLWGGIQLYTYGDVSIGDSIRANVGAARELERIRFSSPFYQSNGFMRIGFSYNFRSTTFTFDLLRAYTRLKFAKVYTQKEEWGYTRYPYIILRVSVPIRREN